MADKVSLVAGLGNPGGKYAATRHNIGFMVLDCFAEKHSLSWKQEFGGEHTLYTDGEIRCHLLKPMTYMNLSGNSVGELCRYYKIESEQIVVVHDELDFEFGKMKLRKGGSPAGHNGIASVISHLGTQLFGRVRMGVAGMSRTAIRGYTAEYVLAPFSAKERESLEEFIGLGVSACETAIKEGFSKAMNEFNRAVKDSQEI